jgi:hypothetical protein
MVLQFQTKIVSPEPMGLGLTERNTAMITTVYTSSVPGLARARVSYDPELSEFCVRLTGSQGQLLGSYFTDDQSDAIATAQAMLEHAGAVSQ